MVELLPTIPSNGRGWRLGQDIAPMFLRHRGCRLLTVLGGPSLMWGASFPGRPIRQHPGADRLLSLRSDIRRGSMGCNREAEQLRGTTLAGLQSMFPESMP